jgi:hypothetical protein
VETPPSATPAGKMTAGNMNIRVFMAFSFAA